MKPIMFIGSSVEGKAVAESLIVALKYEVECRLWTTSFPLSETTLAALVERFRGVGFGAFVLSPDDSVRMRDKTVEIARDNVLFEAGLFMGMHSVERTFIVTPRDHPSFHIASDLLGVTPATYETAQLERDEASALQSVATEIKLAIKRVQKREQRPDITTRVTFDEKANWPLKLWIHVKNSYPYPLAVRSISFEPNKGVPLAKNAHLARQRFTPDFLVGRTQDNKEIRNVVALVSPQQRVETFVPFDPAFGKEALEELHAKKGVGVWHHSACWLEDVPDRYIAAVEV